MTIGGRREDRDRPAWLAGLLATIGLVLATRLITGTDQGE